MAKAQQQMGFAKAAAAILQNVAPNVQAAYTNAANADAGYAKGLGAAAQTPLDQATAQNNQFLAQTGAPASALKAAPDIADTAYGLAGYIPATTLQREGAGFEAAAQSQPQAILGQGQQAATASLNDMTNITPLRNEIAQIASSEPKTYQGLLSNAQNQIYKQQSLGSENAYRKAEIGLRSQSLQLEAKRAANSNAAAWARIGIEDKRLRLEVAKSAMTAKSGGLSPAETSRYTSIAQSWAQRILGQSTDPNTSIRVKQPDGTYKTEPKPLPALSVKDAVTQMLKSGVPLPLAVDETIKVLQNAGVANNQINQIRKEYGRLDKALYGGMTTNAYQGMTGPASGTWNKAVLKTPQVRMIYSMSKTLGLDPAAVLAIASQEGIGGGIGDHGTSFGPFQMHVGGVFPPKVWDRVRGNPVAANKWAWSAAGIQYALEHIASVARGLTGHQAVAAISQRFERPANPQAEIAGAWSNYGEFQ